MIVIILCISSLRIISMSCLEQTTNLRATAARKRHEVTLFMKDKESGVYNLADSAVADVTDGRIEIAWAHPENTLTLVVVTPSHSKPRSVCGEHGFSRDRIDVEDLANSRWRRRERDVI